MACYTKLASKYFIMPETWRTKAQLTSAIKRRIQSFATDCVASSIVNHANRKQKGSSSIIAEAVSAKIEDGNIRAAVRIYVRTTLPLNRLTRHFFSSRLNIQHRFQDALAFMTLSILCCSYVLLNNLITCESGHVLVAALISFSTG